MTPQISKTKTRSVYKKFSFCHIIHIIHMQSTPDSAADLRLYDHTCYIELNFQRDLARD